MVGRRILDAVILLALAATVSADDDWEKKAAQAAQTEKGLYATGGKRDLDVLPLENKVEPPKPAPAPAPKPPTKEELKIQSLKADLAREKIEFDKQIKSLDDRYQQQRALYDGAKQRQKDAEAKLKAKDKNKPWYRYLVDDAETDKLQAEIEQAKKDAAKYGTEATRWRTARDRRTADAKRSAEVLNLQITKLDEDLKTADIAARRDYAEGVMRQFETQRARIEVSELEFAVAKQQLKSKVETATATDKDDEAEAAETELEKLEQTHKQWRKSQDTALETYRADLKRAYEKNRKDGLGPTSYGSLNTLVRKNARARGEDVDAATNYVDTDAVKRTRTTSARVADAAGKNTVHENTAATFLRDVAVDNAVTLFTDPKEFVIRYLHYAKGVGIAAKDAIVDLAVLGYELGDTTAEAIEIAVNEYTGVETNITGKENMKTIGEVGRKSLALLDSDDPEGAKVAEDAVKLAQRARDQLDRRYEKLAGKGKAGVREALTDTGKVVGTIAAPEEALARAAAAKVITKVKGLDEVATLADGTPDLPSKSRGFEALDEAEQAAKLAEAKRAPDVNPAADAAATTGSAAKKATDASKPAAKAEKPPVDVRRNDKGEIVVRDAEGNELVLGDEIGRGASTGVFKVKGRDDIVVRLTKDGPGGDGLDEFGRKAILEADPTGEVLATPATLGSQRISTGGLPESEFGDAIQLKGGTLTIVEKAPTTFDRANDIKTAAGDMSKGQREAYRNALDALNKKGYVFLDNHHGNYSFRKVEGTDDKWVMVIPDRESIGPAVSPEAAAKVQRALDTAQTDPMTGMKATKENWNRGLLGRDASHFALGELDDLMNWTRWQKEAGHNYSSLGKGGVTGEGVFPFDPRNAIDYPNAAKPLDYAPTKTPDPNAPPLKAPEANLDVASLGDGRTPTGNRAGKKRPTTGTPKPDWDPELRKIAIKESNIVPEHAEAFSEVAKRNGEIIMMRPVNPHATDRIISGAATKGMNIKGKSADWGPQAGMIPIDPMYSKMGTPDGKLAEGVTSKKIKQYAELNKKALGQPYEELVDGKWVKRKAKKPIAQELEIDGPDGKKIKVLADFSDPPRPITADYDLFAVSTKRGEGGMIDDPKQMAEMGNIGRNEVETMNRLNDAAKRAGYEGGNIVHHGAANRFANEFEKADFPITVFLPNGNVELLHSANDVRKFYERWTERGFKLDHMPGWDFGQTTQAGKQAERAAGRAKQQQRALDERKAVEDLKKTDPKNRLGVAAGKGIRSQDDKDKDKEEPTKTLKAPEVKVDERQTTGEKKVADKTKPTTTGGAGDTKKDEDEEKEEDTKIAVGGGGIQTSPISTIYFSFHSGSFYDDRISWIDPPKEETLISLLGGKVTVSLVSARTVTGTNVHSTTSLIAAAEGAISTVNDAIAVVSPPPAKPKPKPKPKPTPPPAPPVAEKPIYVTPPGGTQQPPKEEKPPPPPPPKTDGKLVVTGDTRINVKHPVGGAPCPQRLGLFVLKNTGQLALEYEVMTAGKHLQFEKAGKTGAITDGVLQAGQDAAIAVYFTCNNFGAMPKSGTSRAVSADVNINAGKAGRKTVPTTVVIENR